VAIIEITFCLNAFVVIFSKWPAGHGKELCGPSVVRGPCLTALRERNQPKLRECQIKMFH